ncbi:RNA polymerase sigma-70 factor [Actinomadura namibiensis]|uniref:RNA polymerase sigma-70 factor (ECF subfamily) n=1 Tax=Actinomadura namibiensis TaxID=182080 RepID=A0A7W3LN27_ACTNM|nr:RNA polymerase sigma-70 factor [Actinomadura namibiensis]MBA8951154.1 RNA polymerase sigma-70 factor (ECF subfamily) [Actinomadura namibiensis]
MEAAVETFLEQRPRLLGLAYRMLGSAAEAEDVVQDAYLRWSRSGPVEVPAAWLTTVVTHLCLNRLASARNRRERYVGPWLPEPVLTGGGALGPLETAEQRESVSMGVLVLLERLTPAERAVLILREAFGHPHREIARVLGVDEAHSRQLHRRARARVGEPRRRYEADREHHRRVVERFLAAAGDGDVAALERLLAEDVTVWADGGGGRAARRPVEGRDRVARYLRGMWSRVEAARARFETAEVNGETAVLVWHGSALTAVLAVEVAGGRIDAVRFVLNPDKLAYAAAQAAM